jgi:hypothetical protein
MDGVNWKGGQIEVTKETNGGWGITHRTVDNGQYPLDWKRHKVDALRAGRVYAETRNAKLFVEA